MKILDASEPEFGGPMSENEVKDFLVNSHKNVHISSLDEKGEPNIHPTWYYFDNNNDKLYIESGRESKKTRNLRRNNIIYYCVDDDNIPYKGVRGKGIVRISEDVEYNLQIVERIVVKYLGNIQHPTSQTLKTSIRNNEAIIIEITPKFYATWDYAKAKVKNSMQ
jgi:general stress protein 26